MSYLRDALIEILNRRRRIRAESRQLRGIPRLPIHSESLRPVTTKALAATLDCAATHEEWSQTEQLLHEACQIEDLKTDGVNPGDRRALWYLVKGFVPRSVLEVGTNVGASTFYLAAALKTFAGKDSQSLVTVDIEDVNNEVSGEWKKRGLANSPSGLIRSIGCGDLVTFVNASSLAYLEGCRRSFDLVFLDGDHTASTVYQEISLVLDLLNKDGVILLHDYFPKNRPLWNGNLPRVGPYIALRRVRKENTRIKVIPLGELPWPTKLGTHRTTLALVTRQ